MIKLDAMENPYLLPRALREDVARLVADAEINRYPDAAAHGLKSAISRVTNLPPGMDILLGNDTIEHRMLGTLAAKRSLADGVLDLQGNLDDIARRPGGQSFIQRLEQTIPP